jgi:hypothetical protein
MARRAFASAERIGGATYPSSLRYAQRLSALQLRPKLPKQMRGRKRIICREAMRHERLLRAGRSKSVSAAKKTPAIFTTCLRLNRRLTCVSNFDIRISSFVYPEQGRRARPSRPLRDPWSPLAPPKAGKLRALRGERLPPAPPRFTPARGSQRFSSIGQC